MDNSVTARADFQEVPFEMNGCEVLNANWRIEQDLYRHSCLN